MKKVMIILSVSFLFLGLTACGSQNRQAKENRWSKPHIVKEECVGVMHNSKICQENPSMQESIKMLKRDESYLIGSK
ncbi:hypothetical protein RHO12_03630 [Orbus sturtevantii]|uniref:hypothetical protein n=1 Tax=Orbus sturtevantii TaxID=3074109 RepID=UPI00370DAF26